MKHFIVNFQDQHAKTSMAVATMNDQTPDDCLNEIGNIKNSWLANTEEGRAVNDAIIPEEKTVKLLMKVHLLPSFKSLLVYNGIFIQRFYKSSESLTYGYHRSIAT